MFLLLKINVRFSYVVRQASVSLYASTIERLQSALNIFLWRYLFVRYPSLVSRKCVGATRKKGRAIEYCVSTKIRETSTWTDVAVYL